ESACHCGCCSAYRRRVSRPSRGKSARASTGGRIMSWLYLAFAIVAEVIATLSLRATEGFKKKRWIIPMAVFYAVAFFCLALALVAGMPIAIASCIWSAVGVACIALLARLIWKEKLARRVILGLVLIMVGVILVEVG